MEKINEKVSCDFLMKVDCSLGFFFFFKKFKVSVKFEIKKKLNGYFGSSLFKIN